MQILVQSEQCNKLLETFNEDILRKLKGEMQLVELKACAELYRAGTPLRHAYFPVTAVVSLFTPLVNGGGAEVAVVGQEGIVGVECFLGTERAVTGGVVQREGTAWRVRAHVVADLAFDHESVRCGLVQYWQLLFRQMAQSLVCHTHHTMQEQLCTWLLQHLDRQPTDELHVTQERIAIMLGARRESVTQQASKLQREGLIQYQRGVIKVVDREGLEAFCCECYGEKHRAFDELCRLQGAAHDGLATDGFANEPIWPYRAVGHESRVF